MTLALAALVISCVAAVVNTTCLVVLVRRHHRLFGHWVPWRP